MMFGRHGCEGQSMIIALPAAPWMHFCQSKGGCRCVLVRLHGKGMVKGTSGGKAKAAKSRAVVFPGGKRKPLLVCPVQVYLPFLRLSKACCNKEQCFTIIQKDSWWNASVSTAYTFYIPQACAWWLCSVCMLLMPKWLTHVLRNTAVSTSCFLVVGLA
jgi:hypothetical protein